MASLKKIMQKLHLHHSQEQTTPPITIYDKDTDITWKSVNKGNLSYFTQEYNIMQSWSSNSNIRRFISTQLPIDELFKMMAPDKNSNDIQGLYFGYENENFIGLIQVSEPFGNNDHATIEFVIVDPARHNQGYATRMIQSATKKLIKHSEKGIFSSIERENFASTRAFEKNGFQNTSSNTSDCGRRFQIYYLKPRDLSKSNEQEQSM